MDRLSYLMGLMVACPHVKTVNECPFNQFKNTPIDKLITLSYEMDMQQSLDLLDYHKNCMQKRNQLLWAG